MKIIIKSGGRGHGGPKPPSYIIKTCNACFGVGCSGCGGKGRVRVKTPPNPPMRCRACNGGGCGACHHTGWMNGFAF